jgi:hypothetical protein
MCRALGNAVERTWQNFQQLKAPGAHCPSLAMPSCSVANRVRGTYRDY